MTKQNFVFIQPPLPVNYRHKRIMPLGILYISSMIRQEFGDQVVPSLIDAQTHDYHYQEILCELKKKDPDFIGISFWTAQAPFVYRLTEAIRNHFPKAKIIYGGVHTTTVPEDAVPHCDVAIVGEGEITTCELIRAVNEGKEDLSEIHGLAYMQEGEIFYTPSRSFIEDLDSLPFPAWDLLDIELYNTPFHITGGQRFPVMGSRGCPYNCSYCVSPLIWKRKVRWRSPENVLAELNAIYEQFGVKKIHFWDDNMMLFPDFLEKLCNLMIENDVQFEWLGLSRPMHFVKQKKYVPLMKKAGCIGMEMGIESANPKTFQKIQKEESLENIINSAMIMKEHGMYPMFTYMAFNAGETIEGYYFQAKFIESIMEGKGWYEYFHPLPFNIYLGQFSTPHPHTPFWENRAELGVHLAEGYQDYYHHNVNFLPWSLLNDVPVATQKKLTNLHQFIAQKVIRQGQWDFLERPKFEQMIYSFRYYLFVRDFYKRCQGDKSLHEIIDELQREQRLPKREAYQWGGLTVLTLAQIGLLKSGLELTEDIALREITVDKPLYRSLKFAAFKTGMQVLNSFYPVVAR